MTTADILQPETLQDLASLATQARDIHADNEIARSAERTAEAEFLDAVVAAVRPGLRAVAKRPLTGHRTHWHNSLCDSTDTHAQWSGVRVAGEGSPNEDYPRDNEGSYEGESLYLRTDGVFVHVVYSGHWTRWQGRSSEWTSEITELTTLGVARQWTASDIVDALRNALECATQDRERDPARLSCQRIERFRALTTLLSSA